MGVKQIITREQAQTPEQLQEDHGWARKPRLRSKAISY